MVKSPLVTNKWGLCLWRTCTQATPTLSCFFDDSIWRMFVPTGTRAQLLSNESDWHGVFSSVRSSNNALFHICCFNFHLQDISMCVICSQVPPFKVAWVHTFALYRPRMKVSVVGAVTGCEASIQKIRHLECWPQTNRGASLRWVRSLKKE
jgi:hypothetical protein